MGEGTYTLRSRKAIRFPQGRPSLEREKRYLLSPQKRRYVSRSRDLGKVKRGGGNSIPLRKKMYVHDPGEKETVCWLLLTTLRELTLYGDGLRERPTLYVQPTGGSGREDLGK